MKMFEGTKTETLLMQKLVFELNGFAVDLVNLETGQQRLGFSVGKGRSVAMAELVAIVKDQTPDQIEKERDLLRLSVDSLVRKLAKVEKVSRSRLKRMNQRGKAVIEAQATIARLSREASGG